MDEGIRCFYCSALWTPHFPKQETVRKERIRDLADEPICLNCFSYAKNSGFPPILRSYLPVSSHEMDSIESLGESEDFASVELVISALKKAEIHLTEMENDGKRLMKLVCRLQKQHNAVSKWKDSIDHRIAKAFSATYIERRKRSNQQISKRLLRLLIFERDGWKCRTCGQVERLSIDHITPVHSGGGNEAENLQTLCIRCNSSKGAKLSAAREQA